MSIVSNNIRYLRVKHKLSQNGFAVQLRLTRNQINSYENESAQPSIEVLKKIAVFFKVSIDSLVSLPYNKNNFFHIQERANESLNFLEEESNESKIGLNALNMYQMFCNFQAEIDRKS